MTVNKSQGQTFNKVGLYLDIPVFSHGQLYVACSRVRRRKDLFIQVVDSPQQGKVVTSDGVAHYYLKNIVFTEVIDLEDRPNSLIGENRRLMLEDDSEE